MFFFHIVEDCTSLSFTRILSSNMTYWLDGSPGKSELVFTADMKRVDDTTRLTTANKNDLTINF